MSSDLLAMVEAMNQGNLEVQLALQCAPVLTGIKTANLLIIEKSLAGSLSQVLEGEHLLYHLLYKMRDKLVYFIYNRKQLEEYIKIKPAAVLLGLLGHRHTVLEKILEEISKRYESYMTGKGSFPHELGLLLGYPPQDVIGFIDHQGQNFLYKGYWKVYDNPEQAKELFASYDKARERAVVTLYQGNSLKSILR